MTNSNMELQFPHGLVDNEKTKLTNDTQGIYGCPCVAICVG